MIDDLGGAPERPLLPPPASFAIDEALPGAELVTKGLSDLALGVESVESLLVSIGAPRLRRLGIEIENAYEDPEDRLYARLALVDPDSAHGRYNAFVRRLVRFERGAESAESSRRKP